MTEVSLAEEKLAGKTNDLLKQTDIFNKGKTINTKKTKTVNFSKVSNKSKKIK